MLCSRPLPQNKLLHGQILINQSLHLAHTLEAWRCCSEICFQLPCTFEALYGFAVPYLVTNFTISFSSASESLMLTRETVWPGIATARYENHFKAQRRKSRVDWKGLREFEHILCELTTRTDRFSNNHGLIRHIMITYGFKCNLENSFLHFQEGDETWARGQKFLSCISKL